MLRSEQFKRKQQRGGPSMPHTTDPKSTEARFDEATAFEIDDAGIEKTVPPLVCGRT